MTHLQRQSSVVWRWTAAMRTCFFFSRIQLHSFQIEVDKNPPKLWRASIISQVAEVNGYAGHRNCAPPTFATPDSKMIKKLV